MSNGGVRVEGLKTAVRRLEALGVSVQDLKQAFGEIAQEGTDVARAYAPVTSGALQGSIRAGKTKNKAVVYAGYKRVPYAGVQNYGWPARGISGKGFMQKPDEIVAPKAPQIIEDNIEDLIRKYNLK